MQEDNGLEPQEVVKQWNPQEWRLVTSHYDNKILITKVLRSGQHSFEITMLPEFADFYGPVSFQLGLKYRSGA